MNLDKFYNVMLEENSVLYPNTTIIKKAYRVGAEKKEALNKKGEPVVKTEADPIVVIFDSGKKRTFKDINDFMLEMKEVYHIEKEKLSFILKKLKNGAVYEEDASK